MTRTLAHIVMAAAMTCATALPAAAQNWPERPIRVIVPFPPGGPSDIVLRAAMDKMQSTLGQPVVIENRPGAGGNVGAGEAARATPDGYTWFWSTDTVLTINPHIYNRLTFKPGDLVPVTIASEFSQVLVCNQSVGVKSLAELMTKAKAEPMSYASGGAGVPGHLAMEMLLSFADAKMQHIPYRGPALAGQDVIGGQVPCGFLAAPTMLPHIRSGRLVALAMSGTRRSEVLPEVPTVAEAGYPKYDATFMLVMSAINGTPEAVIQTFSSALVEALKQPGVGERLKATDQVVVASTRAEAAQTIDTISRKWAEVAQRIGLKLD